MAAASMAAAVIAIAFAAHAAPRPPRPAAARMVTGGAARAVLAQPAPTLAPVAVLTLPDPPLADIGRPHGVAVAADGTTYVFDQSGRRILALAAGDHRGLRAFGGRRIFGVAGADRHRGVGLAVAPGGDLLAVNGARGVVERFTAGGRLAAEFGPDGTSASRFVAPGGLAVGADGTVFVADTPARGGRGVVHAFGADGRPRAGFGQPLAAPYTLQAPAGLAVTVQGTVLVADMGARQIVELGADGTPLRAFGSPGAGPADALGALRQPAAVAVEAAGTIVVADLDAAESRLLRFAADGGFVGRVIGGTALREPVGLAVAGDGRLVVADAGGAAVWLSPDGSAWSERRSEEADGAAEMPQIVDVAAADDGSTAVLDVTLGRVIRFDPLGRYLGRWGQAGTAPGALAVSPGSIGAIAAGPGGDVYIGDTANRVQRFGADGRLRAGWDVTSGPNQLNGVLQLAVDHAGAFAVTHFGDTHVQLHDSAGARLALWGLWGYRLPGRFLDPAGIALTADRVYVSDRGSIAPRIQAFDRAGGPVAAWGGMTWGVCPSPTPPSTAPQPAYDELAAAPDGTLHAGSFPNGIDAFGRDGQPLGTWGLDPLGEPYARFRYGLDFDAAGRAYLGDRGQQAVRVFAPAPEPFWRVQWFDNRWLAGSPVTVTRVAAFAGDVAPPAGLAAGDWSMQAARWWPLSGGAWRLTATGRGGARAWLSDASFDDWGEATFDGAATARLPAGSYETGIELAAPADGVASLTVRLDQVDAVPPPTRTPVPTMTSSPTPAATGSRATPTTAPTATSTPWATTPPHRIALPIAGVGVAGADRPSPTPPSPWTSPTVPASTPTAAPPSFGGDPALDVRAIAVDLTFDAAPRSLVRAVVTTTVRLRAPASSIALDAEPEGIRLRSAAVDGRTAGWGWAPGTWGASGTSRTRLHVPLGRRAAAGESVVVRLDYAIPPDVRRRALGLAGDGASPAGRMTRASPTFARWWLPSNDAPDDVAAFTAVLRVPAGWRAVASGAPDAAFGGPEGRPASGGGRVVRFAADDVAPHQIAVAAGPFAHVSRAACLANASAGQEGSVDLDRPVPWTWASSGASAPACGPDTRAVAVELFGVDAADDAITRTLDAVAYLDRHVARWPHAHIALVEGVHDVPLDRADVVNVAARASFAPEEAAARAYVGDTARIGDWDDVWIREGFAALLARFRTHDFELGALCECRPESPILEGVDPADRLIARERFGPVPATCLGAAAVLDLHVRVAAAAGLTVDDDRARRLMLRVVRDAHAAFAGRTIATGALIDQLRLALPDQYASAGLDVDAAAARAVVDGWRDRWRLDDAARP